MIKPGEHVIIFGVTGCGKSTLTREVALSSFSRIIIFDRMKEWSEPGFLVVKNFKEFLAEYQKNFKTVKIIVQFRPGISQKEMVQEADKILNYIYDHEQAGGIGVVFEEVWLYAELHDCPDSIREVLLTGRHKSISLISNSQKPALVSKIVTGQSRHMFVGQHFDPRDKMFFQSYGILESPQKYSWVYFCGGEKTTFTLEKPKAKILKPEKPKESIT